MIFLRQCEDAGITWCTGQRATTSADTWHNHREKTTYRLDKDGMRYGERDETPQIHQNVVRFCDIENILEFEPVADDELLALLCV
jgi:hypothetical protein